MRYRKSKEYRSIDKYKLWMKEWSRNTYIIYVKYKEEYNKSNKMNDLGYNRRGKN